jgi:hypothetical protein
MLAALAFQTPLQILEQELKQDQAEPAQVAAVADKAFQLEILAQADQGLL